MNEKSTDGAWHISLQFLDLVKIETRSIRHDGREITTLVVTQTDLLASFPRRFEEFLEAVNLLDNGYAEGDGSFGIVGPNGAWKVCGTVYERLNWIQYVEIIGSCPYETFESIIQLLGVQPAQCVVQDMRGGFFQSPQQFINRVTG